MAFSKIKIEFLSVPNENEFLNISESKLGLSFYEVFKNFRSSTGHVVIPAANLSEYRMTINSFIDISNISVSFDPGFGFPTQISLSDISVFSENNGLTTYTVNSTTQPNIIDYTNQSAILWSEGNFTLFAAVNGSYLGFISENYKEAFNLDYNSSNLFSVSSTLGSAGTGVGSVTIEANYSGAVFGLSGLNANANIVVTNEIITEPGFYFSSDYFTQAATPNTHIRVNVTTNELATKITSPIIVNGNMNNPFYVDVLRGTVNVFTAENESGLSASKTIIAPKILDSKNFNVLVNSSPNGGTVTVSEKIVSGLDLQFSLDNSNFQNQNVFSGLFSGDYSLYIRDAYGALVTIPFVVSEFGIYTPYFFISKSNSIRFANRISWGDAANYKNDENTLGAEVDVQLAYSGCQNFKSGNVITTQFKSNYNSNSVKIIKEDLTEVNVPVSKKTANIGIKDKRDAFSFSVQNGKTGVYFLSGNVYDYDTNVVTSIHSLNGRLPDWAIIGGYITINNSWFLIEEIYYDENKSADIIVFTNNYSGSEAVIVGSIYNDFNYEVYEFTIDMVDYLNQTVQVKIENTDSNFEPVTHLSEKIDVAVNFEKNVEISYWNDDNTDVFYATGIRHLINVELTKQEGVSEEESEAYRTDTTAILLSAQLHEADKFIFEPVSKEIWRKLIIALSHKNVYINGVQYVKNSSFETEGPLDKSNLYVLKATMMKTGIVYNSDSADGNDFATSNIEIPGLIQTEIGFLKY